MKESLDCEKLIQIYHSRIVLDTKNIGENLKKQVTDYVEHLPVKGKEEVFAEVEWCKKMALRAKRQAIR